MRDEHFQTDHEFEAIYQKHYQKLFRGAYRITGNRADSEEVVQEAFLNAYKSWSSFRYESAFDTWIYRIMLNYMTINRNTPLIMISSVK